MNADPRDSSGTATGNAPDVQAQSEHQLAADGHSSPPPVRSTHTGRHSFASRVELFATILLAIATVAASWSAFQSNKWSGVQANSYAASGAARTNATQASATANAQTVVDVDTFIAWASATKAEGDKYRVVDGKFEPQPGTLSAFLFQRFRSEFKPAVNAWIATHPLTNPAAPSTPFAMPEYRLADATKAVSLNAQADDLSANARAANQTSDNFVLLTVLFASVLFFAGISTKFEVHRNKVIMLTLATVILMGTLGVLATFPETF